MKRLIVFVLLFISSFAYSQKNILSLKDAVNIALKNNPDVQISKHKIDAANAKYSSGISLPQPNLSLSYEYTSTGSGLSEYGERTFEINQSFEFPTRYFSRGAKLNKDVESARLEYEYSRLKLTGDVKTKYYKVLLK